MPKCLNDPTRSYKGTEPSPKGLGCCAGKMKVGEKKKGTDGNTWIIKKVKNGSKRWMKVKEYDINKLAKEWWYKIASKEVIVYYKDNKIKSVSINKHEELEKDKNIKLIFWSGMSQDNIRIWIDEVVFNLPNKYIDELITKKKTLKYILENYRKFLQKYKLRTKYDYTFKVSRKKFSKFKLYKKLIKSKIIINKMK
jgi:hypothetical protein